MGPPRLARHLRLAPPARSPVRLPLSPLLLVLLLSAPRTHGAEMKGPAGWFLGGGGGSSGGGSGAGGGSSGGGQKVGSPPPVVTPPPLKTPKRKFSLIKLPDNQFGARCLDGSPPGYHYRPGAGDGLFNWHINLPGGGWCFDQGKCVERTQTYLGTSNGYPVDPTVNRTASEALGIKLGGLLSGNRTANPGFYNWNLVRLIYCDGGAFAGTRGKVAVNASTTIYLDGWNILQAVFADIKTRYGIRGAARILLSGSSAGGQAVVMLCDRVAAQFPSAQTKCFADSGFFMNARDRKGVAFFRKMAEDFTATHKPNYPRCNKAIIFGNLRWTCFFGENSIPYTKTPLFIFQSLFDYMSIIIGNQLPPDIDYVVRCLSSIAGRPNISTVVRDKSWNSVRWAKPACTANERDAVFGLASRLYDNMNKVTQSSKTPLFIFQSLFDYMSIIIGNQLPPDIDYVVRCLSSIAGRPNISTVVRDKSWNSVRWAKPACTANERDAVFGLASRLYDNMNKVTQSKPTMAAFVQSGTIHCSSFSSYWETLRIKKLFLQSMFQQWADKPKVEARFQHD
eukprot:TRINITY_DN13628_c0_g3_i3.p1 TRINITY_DN13628_c0_g3~~TRINITY_DN13628_c0_g3_i3.p1  ORF type:complete len:565 (+),score=6.80 TRINITY_DN13628_c0_g3_i3:253-1947(+)